MDIAEGAFPRDINNRGEVVGVWSQCDDGGCPLEGFVWSLEGGLQNLSSFVIRHQCVRQKHLAADR